MSQLKTFYNSITHKIFKLPRINFTYLIFKTVYNRAKILAGFSTLI